jgi:hypothetical protein
MISNWYKKNRDLQPTTFYFQRQSYRQSPVKRRTFDGRAQRHSPPHEIRWHLSQIDMPRSHLHRRCELTTICIEIPGFISNHMYMAIRVLFCGFLRCGCCLGGGAPPPPPPSPPPNVQNVLLFNEFVRASLLMVHVQTDEGKRFINAMDRMVKVRARVIESA